MNFGTAIATGFQKYSDFTGKSSRSEFWWFNLFLVLVSFGASALWDVLGAVWFLATIVPYLAVGVRRLPVGAYLCWPRAPRRDSCDDRSLDPAHQG
jgi:hypothetical protein